MGNKYRAMPELRIPRGTIEPEDLLLILTSGLCGGAAPHYMEV